MKRSVLFVALAGLAAAVAAIVVYSALAHREAEIQQARVQSVDIVVAARNLPLGTRLDQSTVKLARWSKDSIPPGAYTNPAQVINSVVKSDLVENEPITGGELFEGQKSAGVMPLLIPDGMRAMSVPVDEVSDIAGFVLPNSRVDVLVALADQSVKPFSKIVLQDVQVLAVAQEMQKTNGQPKVVKVVTLLVTPEQAEKLALASREGTLRLAMRGYDDRQIVQTTGQDIATMLGTLAAPVRKVSAVSSGGPRVARPHRGVDVEIMRDGKNVQSMTFVNQASAGETPVYRPRGRKLSERTLSASPAAAAAAPHARTLAAAGAPAGAGAGIAADTTTGYVPVPKTIDIP